MSDLDFYAHVATHCDVFGVGVGSDPDDWEAALGSDYLDVFGRGRLRRDYGLVEVSFFRNPQGTYSCSGFSVQIHRQLYASSPGDVPLPLSREYGNFAPRAQYEEVRARILSMGHSIELEKPDHIHRYHVPESGARVFVMADPNPYGSCDHDPADPELHQADDVWSVSVACRPLGSRGGVEPR
ncbi:hypothetical protein [Streptomyces sp. NPDC003077]|uniref:hypothetical protein n=1 Tax=Streptomyces sp. NPDC003077 TaxID=3154443 RepID=UPI0033BED7A0